MSIRLVIVTFLLVGFMSFGKAIGKMPIVFHKTYIFDDTVKDYIFGCNLEKYKEVYEYLVKIVGIKPDDFYQPKEKISDSDLQKIHDKRYLDSLNSTDSVVKVLKNSGFEISKWLSWAWNSTLQSYLLDPYRYAVAGTVLAVQLALHKNGPGWSINLSGGYHRAYSGKGDTLCFFNDIAMALYTLRHNKKTKNLKVLVVNLDFHAGLGLTQICSHDNDTYTLDFYAEKLDEDDKNLLRQGKDIAYKLYSGIKDRQYTNTLTTELALVIKTVQPGLIIYNAGTDIYSKDPLNNGTADISQKGIVLRDEIVFQCARKNNIPITMLLSGGLHKDTGSIICASLANLIEKKLILA